MPADTYSPNLRIQLQADGNNNSTWGDIANVDFNLFEQAIAGLTALVTAGGTTTLTTANGASDQARAAILQVSGALASAATIVIPNVSKIYFVQNITTNAFSVTVQTPGSPVLAQVIPQGQSMAVFCDGAGSVLALSGNATTLNGVAGSSYARLDAGQSNAFLSQNSHPFKTLTYAATTTIDASTADNFIETLTGNVTYATPTNPKDGQHLVLWIVQDASGSRTAGFSSAWLFQNSYNIGVDQTPNAITIVDVTYNAAVAKWVGTMQLGYQATGLIPYSLNLTSSQENFCLIQALGGVPGAAANVYINVARGVVISSPSTAVAAMDLSGLPSGSVVTLINAGYILGCGGRGGDGAALTVCNIQSVSQGFGTIGRPGLNGGDALKGAGSGTTVNVTNANGFIWGGGGGGGGGAASGIASPNNSEAIANGGGGGGGAGGGKGGLGGAQGGSRYILAAAAVDIGNPGTDGGTGPNGVLGAGGTAGTVQTAAGATAANAPGGAGGDWGAAGTAGTANTTYTGTQNIFGAAGSPGKAVNLNSGTVSFVSGGTAPNVKGAIA